MTTTTQTITLGGILADTWTGLRMVASHIAGIPGGVASVEKAMRLRDLTDEELDELGITRDQIIPYAFGEKL